MEGSLPEPAPAGEAAVSRYSFAQMLTGQWQTVKAKNLLSKTILDELIRVVKGRIAVEETYSKGLAKLSTPISNSYATLTEAVVGFSSDILNKSVQHKELAENLQTDVLNELQNLREDVYKSGRSANTNITALSTRLKNGEVAYRKAHRAYDRAYHEASGHCISLKSTDPELAESLNDRVHEAIQKAEETGGGIATSASSLRKSAMHSLGIQSPTKDLVNWLLPSDSHKKHTTVEAAVQHLLNAENARANCLKAWDTLNAVHVQCAIEFQAILNDMQGLEERVIFEIQDMLRKHIVLESSCFANLQYDIQMLFGVMES
ncbi:hypothetical protein TrRE_jg11332, partial [Triparma retinervis]